MCAPVFSVIIPIYNVENYLEQCIDSVLSQTYVDFEIILVDDGSSDSCPSICENYARRDNRISVIHKPNGGLSDARNRGLKMAKGEYLIFLDSDDYYLNTNFFSSLYDKISNSSYDILFFKRRKLYESSNRIEKMPSPFGILMNKELNVDNLIYSLSTSDELDASAAMKVVRRSLIIDNNIYFQKNLFSEDVEWFFRLIKYVRKASVINDIAYCYRIRKESISHSITLKNIQDLFYSIETYASEIHESAFLTKMDLGLLNYLCYQYCIVVGLIGCYLRGEDYLMMIDACKKFKWLCSYSCSSKTKGSSSLIKLLGLKLSSFILGLYIAHK
jgi:glycosyltransferase involved in cell wall biosynthesis